MEKTFRDAVRELKLNPAVPIRVWVDGMVVEMRTIGGRGSTSSSPSSSALASMLPAEAKGPLRAAMLVAAARAVSYGRIAEA